MRFEGGTHATGVAPADWDMGPGLAIRYDRPAPALTPFVSGYTAYWAAPRAPRIDWFLPAGPMLCFLVDAGPVAVSIGRRRFACPSDGFLLGTTSRAYRAETCGGALVGIGLTPGGWARLTDRPAAEFTDAVVPLDAVLGGRAGALDAEVRALPDDAALRDFADRAMTGLLHRPAPDEALVAAMSAVLLTDGVAEVGDAADRLGMEADAVRRLAARCFGLTPKRLLRRARFLRSLLTYLDDPAGGRAIDSSYHDESHFLRDAAAFLGTTPRRFFRRRSENDFLCASLRLRAAVLGAPLMALHGAASAADEKAAA